MKTSYTSISRNVLLNLPNALYYWCWQATRSQKQNKSIYWNTIWEWDYCTFLKLPVETKNVWCFISLNQADLKHVGKCVCVWVGCISGQSSLLQEELEVRIWQSSSCNWKMGQLSHWERVKWTIFTLVKDIMAGWEECKHTFLPKDSNLLVPNLTFQTNPIMMPNDANEEKLNQALPN